MKKREAKPSYKCHSDGYTLDSLRIYYAGNDSYLIRAVISDRWILCTGVSRSIYDKYRIQFYTDIAGAKNFLLDQLSWENHPFARDGFRFINVGEPLSEDALNGLIRFVSTLK